MAWANGYTYRRLITIDHTKVSGSGDLSNFPVLIKGTYAYLATTANGGNVEDSNGYDIIFETTGGTPLDFEKELYVASTGEVVFWVKIPTLDGDANTTFYIYYGNSSINTSQEDIPGAWSSFNAVYHLNEGGGAAAFKDRTSGANHMSSSGSQLTFGVTGKINKAVSRNGSTTEVSRLLTDGNLNLPSGSLTVLAWVKTNADSQNGNAQYIWEETAGRFRLFTTGGNSYQWRLYKTSGTLEALAPNVLDQTWQHVAFRIESGVGCESYLDGVSTDTGTTVDSYIGTNNKIALLQSGTTNQGINGAISHVKIAIGDLGEDWIITEFNNQDDPSTFYSLGTPETSGSTETSDTNFELTGEDSANSDTLFELTGSITFSTDYISVTAITADTSGTDRLFELTGIDIATSDRNFELSGIDSSVSDTNFEITGITSISDDINFELTGITSASNTINFELTGFDSEVSDTNFELIGINTVDEDILFEITGANNLIQDINFELVGIDIESSDILFEVKGSLTVNSDINFELIGIDSISSDREFELRGYDSLTQDVLFELTGINNSVSDRLFELRGIDSFSGDVNFELTGFNNLIHNINFELRGIAAINTDINLELTGSDSLVQDISFELTGINTIQSDISFELTGIDTANNDINFEVIAPDILLSPAFLLNFI